LGSLLAAVGSFLDARAHGAEWLVRIEDVDRTREVPGATDAILRTLERFALHWDGPVWRQSERSEAYAGALEHLTARGLTYRCSCTRGELAGSGSSESRYPGLCRRGPRKARGPYAMRFRAEGLASQTVIDRLQPPLTQSVDATTGDFIIRRRDGLYAYQLAVVVDDAAQGITDVVRGLDLYDNTPRQRLLQESLEVPTPRYLHLPLIADRRGAKLSKSRGALAATSAGESAALAAVLGWLGMPTPAMLHGAPLHTLLEWARPHWNINNIQGVIEINSDR